MSKPTTAYITIEIDVPVSGNWRRAEPDVGLNEGYFEDAQIDWVGTLGRIMDLASVTYEDEIQEALTEAATEEKERADDRRDEAADAKAHYDREKGA